MMPTAAAFSPPKPPAQPPRAPSPAPGARSPIQRAPSYSAAYSPFHQQPPEVLLRRLRCPLQSAWGRLEAFIELETCYRFLYPERRSTAGVTCQGVAVGTQAALAAHLHLSQAALCRTLHAAERAGLLWRGSDQQAGLVLAFAPLQRDAWLWELHAHRPEPFQPQGDRRHPHRSAPLPEAEDGLPLSEDGLPFSEDGLPFSEDAPGSPIKERARVLDPDPTPPVRPDLTGPVPVVSSHPSSAPPPGPDRGAAKAPGAPPRAQEAPRRPQPCPTPRVWLDPAWSLPEALSALDLPSDVAPLPTWAQVDPDAILDAFTCQGRTPFPLRDLAPLLAQLLTVEQLRCIDSHLKRALRRGDLRDPRAYVLQAARAILDGTSHTAPPRHACPSLRPPGREAGDEEADGGQVVGEAVGEATPAPAPGMEALRRWRDGLDEVTRRDFDARCYLLRAELRAYHGEVVGGAEEEMEEVVWQAAWAEVRGC